MKRALKKFLLTVTLCSCLIPAVDAQNIIATGPWKLFRQEHPALSYEEILTPFVVREIRGTVSSGEGGRLKDAYFEIGLGDGSTLGTPTSKGGQFELKSFGFVGPFVRSKSLRPGTYRFKVTKDGFHSAVGTIVVSRKAPKQAGLAIDLKPAD